MTTRRDPDTTIAAWLDELATPLPTSTQRAIDVAIRTTPQDRRRGWWSRRSTPMSFLRLGAVAAVLVVAVGAFSLLRPAAGPGVTPTTSPGPSASALPDPSTWETFTSERFGYQIGAPADWDVYPAVGDGPFYAEDSESQEDYDRVTIGAGFSGVYVASAPLEAGVSAEDWIAEHLCPCEPELADFERLTVDGQPAWARLETSAEPFIGVVTFAGDRVYSILGVNVLARDRALFDAFLSTIRLLPDDAVDAG
jgi:hypothetical protein